MSVVSRAGKADAEPPHACQRRSMNATMRGWPIVAAAIVAIVAGCGGGSSKPGVCRRDDLTGGCTCVAATPQDGGFDQCGAEAAAKPPTLHQRRSRNMHLAHRQVRIFFPSVPCEPEPGTSSSPR